MPTNRARKAAARTARREGESYTAALRRLDTSRSSQWETSGQGLGCTEFTTTIAGRDVMVICPGDHKTPWPGFWEAVEVGDGSLTAFAAGRVRLPQRPTDDHIREMLTVVGEQILRTLTAGEGPGWFDTSHGAVLTLDQVEDDVLYFLSWDQDDWAIRSLNPIWDDGGAPARFEISDEPAPAYLTISGSGFVDHTGAPVSVYEA